MSETRETRLKRLRMRSMRRGIKEMDLILIRFCDAGGLTAMDAAELDAYEALLDENDQQLYAWMSGRDPAPERHGPMVSRITSVLEGVPFAPSGRQG